MIHKGLAASTALALLVLASLSSAQTSPPGQSPAAAQPKPAAIAHTPPAPAASPAAQGGAAPATQQPADVTPPRTDCFGGNCDATPPRIAISTPAPAPAPWPWQERVAWGANIVLVILGYIAVMIGLALLRKIERQTRYAEETAQAAAEAARAALKHAEASDRAERPWILMSVRPALNIDNGFTVIATNHGRGPARILSTIDEVVCSADECNLAPDPVYKGEQKVPPSPVILLPGESTNITSFSRSDVDQVCGCEERLKRIENWEEKLFLYGKVAYCDLVEREAHREYESSWFCWYIHGRQKSGMVMAGPPSYNRHT